MGFNLSIRCETCRLQVGVLRGCETCRLQVGVLRGYEAAAIAIVARDHGRDHIKRLQVDNGWSEPEEEWDAEGEGEGEGYGEELVYPPDWPLDDQPDRYIERGF